jgi:hypothetical protein
LFRIERRKDDDHIIGRRSYRAGQKLIDMRLRDCERWDHHESGRVRNAPGRILETKEIEHVLARQRRYEQTHRQFNRCWRT